MGTQRPMGKTSKVVIVVFVTLLVLLFFTSIYVSVEETMPENTVVVVTEQDRLYHSIHFDHICIEGKRARTMTLAEARAAGYSPHPHDEELGYFRGNRRYLFHDLLAGLGIQVNSRWDRNGNWLW